MVFGIALGEEMKKLLLLIVLLVVWLIAPLLTASALSFIGGVGPVEMLLLYLAWLVVVVLIWRSQSKKLNR